MIMPGRNFQSTAYRYGFNGKENDNEVKGQGNQQDYGMRIYDPRVGRFLSVDPITKQYPELTPYQFSSNNPIAMIDVDGLEGIVYYNVELKALAEKYGHIDRIFAISKNQSDAAWLGLASDQTVLFKSNWKDEKINYIVKLGNPQLPPVIVYKYDLGPQPAYQRWSPVFKSKEIGFIGNRNEYQTDQSSNFKEIANALTENKSLSINVSGSTMLSATDLLGKATIDGVEDTDWTVEDLVNARTRTIVNSLIKDYGVDPNRINITPPSFGQSSTSTFVNIYDQKDKPKNLVDVEKDVPEKPIPAPNK